MAPPKKKAAKKKAAPKKRAVRKKAAPKAKVPAKKGRPSDFTPELGEELCLRLIHSQSVREVCEAVDMPNKSTVFRWLLKSEQENASPELITFRDQYVRANKMRAEYRADQLEYDLKDYAMSEVLNAEGKPVKGADGKPLRVMTKEGNQFAKIMLDAFKWRTGKEHAKKYGDKTQMEHSGEIKTPNVLVVPGRKSVDEWQDNEEQ